MSNVSKKRNKNLPVVNSTIVDDNTVLTNEENQNMKTEISEEIKTEIVDIKEEMLDKKEDEIIVDKKEDLSDENKDEENVDKSDDLSDENKDEEVEEESVDFEQEVKNIIEEIGFEAVYLKLTQKSTVQNIAKSGSKMEKSVEIYQEMIVDPTNRRIDIINAFMSQQGISKDCASTYFQTIRTRLKKVNSTETK